MLWNYDVSDKEEAERMASLYGGDDTRVVEPGMEVETGRNLVRRCGNELGIATWEAYDFDPNTWTCETFSNREAAELWLSGSLYLDECVELDRQLTQSVKRMAALAANMSGGRWTAGIQEYRDGRKSLSFQLSDETGFFLITSPICKASELALGVVRDRVREELADLDPYREALEACRRAGVYENPVAVIGTMLAEAALEHARADAEYFDEDFRMRATEGIDMWTVAREIAKTVPEAKPAEEEPTQTRGPKL